MRTYKSRQQYMRDYRERNRREGRCTCCGIPSHGRALCGRHREMDARRQRNRRQQAERLGV